MMSSIHVARCESVSPLRELWSGRAGSTFTRNSSGADAHRLWLAQPGRQHPGDAFSDGTTWMDIDNDRRIDDDELITLWDHVPAIGRSGTDSGAELVGVGRDAATRAVALELERWLPLRSTAFIGETCSSTVCAEGRECSDLNDGDCRLPAAP